MTELQIFNNPEFGSIRSIEQNGEPWFVGKDVALALGYKDTVNALKSHVDEQDKAGWRITTQFGEKETTIINESGVYSLIFSSKLEGAQRFKRWVTSEVLPSIRKTGCYGTPRPLRAFAGAAVPDPAGTAAEAAGAGACPAEPEARPAAGHGGLWHRRLAQGERPDHCPHRTGPGWRAARPERLSDGIHPAGRAGALQPYRPARSAPQQAAPARHEQDPGRPIDQDGRHRSQPGVGRALAEDPARDGSPVLHRCT